MRHLRAAVTTLVVALATVAAAPGASAQEPPPAPMLETCTVTPAAVTLRPGEVAETIFTFAPSGGEALYNTTFDGVGVIDAVIVFSAESPLTAQASYDDFAKELSEDLGRTITDGVLAITYSRATDGGDPGDTEVLCTLTITLTTAPEPTTTTTTLPTITPAAAAPPRFTG